MRMQRIRSRSRRSRNDGGLWLSFSDLMSSLLLIIILVLFYIMYQYFEMYELNMAEIARQQFDLDTANASLDEERGKLTAAEQQLIAQEIKLNAAQKDLEDAQAILASQQEELSQAQSLLEEKENEIAAQEEQLNALSVQLGQQQTQIYDQQAQLDEQQRQIEQLVGLKTRIISSLSDAFRASNIQATVDPNTGSIALESEMLFDLGQSDLKEEGKRWIDSFLPVYLGVLFSDEYRPYVAEIIIEGHTDSTGEYIRNLELSQQRAGAVAKYVLGDGYSGISPQYRIMLRQLVTANGRSFSDPVLRADGTEDMDASRRVVFKFRLTDESMILQMKDILEETPEVDLGTAGSGAAEDAADTAEAAGAAEPAESAGTDGTGE